MPGIDNYSLDNYGLQGGIASFEPSTSDILLNLPSQTVPSGSYLDQLITEIPVGTRLFSFVSRSNSQFSNTNNPPILVVKNIGSPSNTSYGVPIFTQGGYVVSVIQVDFVAGRSFVNRRIPNETSMGFDERTLNFSSLNVNVNQPMGLYFRMGSTLSQTFGTGYFEGKVNFA
ncbi:hypothetical protein BK124_00755 [Paenibacillus amylolyticus]|uniref:hypothetical protein n=1 Tax=Paenibacillus amylolyticus TaxID=1451 RepID=UPI000970022A|nr:hypothetical protein [Paenibacillus amylolyticus]OMF01240.1 hypothetical protein BK124_00755 [Paenibacillus amylolyticus]